MTQEVRSVRNNNPGNLRAGDPKTQAYLTQPGYVLDKAVGFDDQGFAIFPDKESGMSAMQRQIRIDAGKGMTGAEMIRKYAPESENDTDAYIHHVFTKSGIDPNRPIDPNDIDRIQYSMVNMEGGKRASDVYYAGKPSSSPADGGALVAATPVVAAASRMIKTKTTPKTPFMGDAPSVENDVGTLGQYRGLGSTYANSSRSAQSRFQAAAEERAQRQAQREQERRARAERIAQRVAMRKQKMSATRVAENTIGFKDFRKKIYEQIIMNEEKENQE